MTTTMNSRLSWAGDILLLNTFRPLLTEEGAAKFRRSLWLAGLQGTLEGVGLFAVIPTITAFVEGGSSMGLTWQGWVWVLAALAVAGAVVTYFQSTIGYLAAMDVMGKLSVRIGDQVASLPLGWFRSSFLGRLSRLLIQGLMHLGEGLAHFTAPLVRGAATTVVMMVLSWFWSWQLGLSLLISMPAMCLIMIASRALWLRGESVVQPTEQELAARIVEFCETQPVLRAAGRAEGYEPLRNARRANERAARKCLGLGVTANFLSGLGAQAVAVVLIVLAARMGSNGTLAPVATVAFVGVSLRYAKVLEDVVSAALSVETARKPVSEVDEILSAEVLPEPEAPSDMTAPGEVSLEDVSFGYDKEHPVVHDVTFTAPAGGLTAIVGPSGAGKTTLFRLMARFWGVDLGTVRVGGLDVRDQTTEQLMSQLAMVFQDVYLYDSTLAENIRIGAPDATDEQVWKAGSLAGVDEIAARLPGGWDASVGEGGRRLSGGERQRVPVARALLKRAPILLFDEATSALDPEDEAHVEAAAHRGLGIAHPDRGVLRDRARQGEGLPVRVVDEAVGQAEAQRLLGVDAAGGEDQVGGPRPADAAGHQLGAPAPGDDPDGDLRQREERPRAGDDEVAGQGQLAATAHGIAVDRGDRRDGQVEQGAVGEPVAGALGAQLLVGEAVALLEVGTDAEGLVVARGEHHRAHRGVLGEGGAGRGERGGHLSGDGVHRLGAVEDDLDDAVLVADGGDERRVGHGVIQSGVRGGR